MCFSTLFFFFFKFPRSKTKNQKKKGWDAETEKKGNDGNEGKGPHMINKNQAESKYYYTVWYIVHRKYFSLSLQNDKKIRKEKDQLFFHLFVVVVVVSIKLLPFLPWLIIRWLEFLFLCVQYKREPPCCFLIQSKDVPVRSYTGKENGLKCLETTDLKRNIVWIRVKE